MLIGKLEKMISNLSNFLSAKIDLGDNPILVIHSTPESFIGIEKKGFNKSIGIPLFETDRIPLH